MLDHPIELALAADADILGLAFAMLLAGLAGGFVHCAAMCGPFVVAQTLARSEGLAIDRLRGAPLAPYHLGRATSYVALGAVFGAVGGAVASLPGLRSPCAGAQQQCGGKRRRHTSSTPTAPDRLAFPPILAGGGETSEGLFAMSPSVLPHPCIKALAASAETLRLAVDVMRVGAQ